MLVGNKDKHHWQRKSKGETIKIIRLWHQCLEVICPGQHGVGQHHHDRVIPGLSSLSVT